MGHLAVDVQIAMLTEERQTGNCSALDLHSVHLLDLPHVLESDLLENEFQRWVFKTTATASRNHHVSNVGLDLQERFKKHVILVTVREQEVVDPVRQIRKRKAVALVLKFVTDRRIDQDRHIGGFQ